MLSNNVYACCGLTLVSFQGYHPALSLTVRERGIFHHVNDINGREKGGGIKLNVEAGSLSAHPTSYMVINGSQTSESVKHTS